MSNLLPEDQKKIVRQRYLWKYTTVALFFFCAFLVFSILSLLPSYFATSYTMKVLRNDALQQQETKKETSKEGEQLVASLKKTNSLSELILAWVKEKFAYEALAEVVEKKADGVVITTVAYDRKNGTIAVSGRAHKRDDLIAFKNALEEGNTFKGIDLPVSDLAHKEDIAFTITVGLATP